MARDGSGTYTRISNTFSDPVANTTISPSDAIAFFDELETEMTDSLSRSGKGGMSADLDLDNNDINNVKTAVFKGSTSGNTTVIATAIAGTTTLTLPAATDTLVGKATTDTLTNKTFVAPALGTPASGTLTNTTGFPVANLAGAGTGVLTALAVNVGSAGAPVVNGGALGTPSSGTLTNCTIPVTVITGMGTGAAAFLATPSSANLATLLTDETGTGANVFATSPTITTPNIVGTTAVGDAAAGSVGEYIESNIASGSAVAAGATTVSKNLTSITLSAGDWDVAGTISWIPAATTVISGFGASISTTTNTGDTTNGRNNLIVLPSGVTGAGNTTHSNVLMPLRFNVSGSTTIYLVGTATYTTSSLSMYGCLRARRVR